MDLETMRYETDGDLIRLTLDRPEVLNAVDYQGTLELRQAAQATHDDPHARTVVIRGTGRAFRAGIDLKEYVGGRDAPLLLLPVGPCPAFVGAG